MKYRVKLFALMKDRAGCEFWVCHSEEPLSAKTLMDRFFMDHDRLAGLRGVTRLAVNQAFCLEDRVLAETDELALIPPVSGG